jgi:hypothetical protein
MKYPNELRLCPNGWTDCELCAFVERCKAGMFDAVSPNTESNLDIVIKAAEIAEKVVQAEAVESVEKIKGTWAEQFMALSPDEAMDEFYQYHVPSLHDKEVIPPGGPSKPGGGSKSKRHKKPKIRIPEYLKTWGT